MIRKTILLLCLCFLALGTYAAGRAKYVFYFIGDGMGVNQVNMTETYMAALDGRIGTKPLLFASFPYVSLVTTYSSANGVTDSAAAGTALSSGKKTKNGALGVLSDLKTPVNSIAAWAQRAGAAVGVTTTVSVDHATPAAFYAHNPSRQNYHEIGGDLIASGYDFFAGSDFLKPLPKDAAPGAEDLYARARRAGYVITNGYDQARREAPKAGKMIMLQGREANAVDRSALPYAIDRTPQDMTLAQITRTAIGHLIAQPGKDGFFLMVEGGKIDWACHSNDPATAVREVMDLDSAVQVAYDFYRQHPDETLIVVTADHETGGLSLGRGPYELHTELLAAQRMSANVYSRHLRALRKELGDKLTWEVLRADLQKHWGLGSLLKLDKGQEDRLRRAYGEMMAGTGKDEKSLYATIDNVSDTMRDLMCRQSLLGWQSTGHSNGYVPAFAVGVGAEAFQGRMDNTAIAPVMAKAAGWTMF